MYKINSADLQIIDNLMRLLVNNEIYNIQVSEISRKLETADREQRETYELINDGNAIYWPLINETLSIERILDSNKCRFIAYFDYLGFASIVNNNPLKTLYTRVGHSYRDIEYAMAHYNPSQFITTDGLLPADFSNLKCNCVTFSDTVIFYTDQFDKKAINSLGKEIKMQLIDLIKVCNFFNMYTNQFYAVRGCLTVGEMDYDYLPLTKDKTKNFHYYRNGVFGKGLIEAYILGESQNWAGAFADHKVIDILKNNNLENTISEYFIKYNVPYNKKIKLDENDTFKIIEEEKEEYCFRLISKATTEEIADGWKSTRKESYIKAFERKQPMPLEKSVQKKLENTLNFFEYCIDN